MDRSRAVSRRFKGIQSVIKDDGGNDEEFAQLWTSGGIRPTGRIIARYPSLSKSEVIAYAAHLGLPAAATQAPVQTNKVTKLTPLLDRMDALQSALDNAVAVLADHEARIKAYEDNWAAFTETPSAHAEPEML